MNRTAQSRLTILALCCVLGGAAACAATPKPSQLEEASLLLKSEEAADLKTLRPRLLRQAREHEIDARAAYKRGDIQQAKMHAHLAIQKYQIARNFALRAQAQQLTVGMKEATKSLDSREAQIAIREQEKARYSKLKQSFDVLQNEQSTQRQSATSEAAKARRALLGARTLQAEVIGQSAIQYHPGKYAQARLLIETSLAAYETKSFADALRNATQASSLLSELLELAKQPRTSSSQPTAVATTPTTPAGVQSTNPQSNALAAQARQAIDEAVKAQSSAIGAGMDKSAPSQYAQAKFLLQSAERRFSSKAYADAQQKAGEARVLFAQGAKAKVDDSGEKKVQEVIQNAEDARSDAIRRSANKSNAFTQADYALDLARKAAQSKKTARALQQATQAALLFKQAKAPEPVKVTPSVSTTSTPAPNGKVEQMIVALQVKRADGLVQLLDSTCPGPFKSFEALLSLAQKRLDANDQWQAFEFAVRASERLKQCQLTTKTTSAQPSAQSLKEAQRARKVFDAEKRKAATALQEAQVSYAGLSTRLSGDARLREPASLIANAEQWYKKQTFAQTIALTEKAQKVMSALEKTVQQEQKASALKEKARLAKQQEAAKAAKAKLAQVKPTGDCKVAGGQLEQAQAAKLRAANLSMSASLASQFKRHVQLLTRAGSMHKSKQCDDASLLATQAQSGFEFLLAMTEARAKAASSAKTSGVKDTVAATTPKAALSPEAIKARMKVEQDRKKQEAMANQSIAKAMLWRSKVVNLQKKQVFQTADQILQQAKAQAKSSQWTNAAVLAEQSAMAFSNMADESSQAQKANEAKWKPAYSKVIKALQRRDEVQPMIGDKERAMFELGTKSLARARTAWEGDQFFVSGKFADVAHTHFDRAAQAAQQRMALEKKQAEANATAAQREARRKRELEIKRKSEEAKRKAAEAKQALAKQDAARKAAEVKREQQQKVLAEDALRRASVSYELCVSKNCSSRDAKVWIASKREYDDASAAMKEGRYTRAQTLAASAKMSFDETLKKPLPFTVDASITRVTRVGDTLSLSPKISFKPGGIIATAESLKTINELARVLNANKATIRTVTLIGYTDSRGKPDANIKLSRQRAQAVKALLIKKGVAASSIVVDGRGPKSPVADNRNAAGREANRRVEVELSWVK